MFLVCHADILLLAEMSCLRGELHFHDDQEFRVRVRKDGDQVEFWVAGRKLGVSRVQTNDDGSSVHLVPQRCGRNAHAKAPGGEPGAFRFAARSRPAASVTSSSAAARRARSPNA